MTYRERTQAALTHPATFVALAALLLNDLALKWIWQGAWFTGKLSDLAWLVFAAPLLAFALSFAARGNVRAQRWTWRVAYIGLPLLYLAYNSIAPLHDAIMSAFSLARGTPGASPFDPTDSIVIPFGSAIALWIWRRSAAAPKPNLRLRLSAFMAAAASLATIATSEPPPVYGIMSICVSDNARGWEALSYAVREWDPNVFVVSEEDPDVLVVPEEATRCGGQQFETPRGTFKIEGVNIVRTLDGQDEVVFTATVLNERADHIVIETATTHIENREVLVKPRSIYYSPKSDEVVAAMGLQGVVVGTADGKWTREGVGIFQPIDFSILARLKRLNQLSLWATALALSGALATLALLFSGGIEKTSTKIFSALSSIPPLLLALVSLNMLSLVDRLADDFIVGICFFDLMLTVIPLSFLRPTKAQFRDLIVSAIGMVILFALTYFIRLSGAIEILAAKAYALAAMTAVAIALCVYLRRNRRKQSDDDATQQRTNRAQ